MTNTFQPRHPHSLPEMLLAGLSDLRSHPPCSATVANLLDLLLYLPPNPLRNPDVDGAVLLTIRALRELSQAHRSTMLQGRYALVSDPQQGAPQLLRAALQALPRPGALADLLEVLYHRQHYSFHGYGLDVEVLTAVHRLRTGPA